MVGILTLDLKTVQENKSGFRNQIGAFNLMISLITLIFLRVNWFFIWIASMIIFLTTFIILSVTLKTKPFDKREDMIILISNFIVYLVSYCIEYRQLKYWLQKQLFDKEKRGLMLVMNQIEDHILFCS